MQAIKSKLAQGDDEHGDYKIKEWWCLQESTATLRLFSSNLAGEREIERAAPPYYLAIIQTLSSIMEGVNICNNSDLPPGFRFHPTDQELIVHYLRKKVSSSSQTPAVSIVAEVDLYKFNPWELPGKALFGENEWFFFSPRDRKYPNGARPNRSAASGYWKATGTDKPILAAGGTLCLGVKKALVFYSGRPPKGIKTDWVMHEYRLLDNPPTSQKLKGSMRLDDWVLCRVRQKGSLPLQIGDNHNESPEASHSFDDGYLGKLFLLNKNDFIQDTDADYQVLGQLSGSHEDIKGPFRNVVPNFHRTPEASNGTNMFLQESLGTQFFCSSSNNQILDSPKRSFSIGSGGELEDYMQLLPPPSKRLSTSNNGDNSTDEASPSYSTTLHSCFSEYIA